MWKPNDEGLGELVKLFKDFNNQDNKVQIEIYHKINDYSKHNDFAKYLVYILNSKNENSVELRQVAGLTLKGVMERAFLELPEDFFDYFKENVTINYLDSSMEIRKTISNLINTFLRLGGVEMWPEVLEFLLTCMDSEMAAVTGLETINYIIEDSGSHLEEKCYTFLIRLIQKLIYFLEKIHTNHNTELTNIVLTSLYILTENCPNLMNEEIPNIVKALINLIDTPDINSRYHLGRCWLSILKLKKEYLSSLLEPLFSFFMGNFSVDNYQMNFTAAEFFSMLIKSDFGENDGNKLIQIDDSVFKKIGGNLKELLTALLQFTKLTCFDISEVENRNSEKHSMKEKDDEPQELEEEWEGYNPNFTLRKCCSRLIENLSTLFPHLLFEILKPVLENEMQHQDWIIKERSILALGAISVGAYSSLKPHLFTIIPFLIRELQHPHKLVRAISCWTLSRFNKFILVDNNTDNSSILFKEYLIEILKKFFDKEAIVQEAACTCLSNMVVTDKEKLEPYLFDIFKVLTEVFDQFSGTSLLTLYDIISLVTEYFEEHFKNPSLIGKLVNCVVNRWYNLVKSGDCKIISPIFEMVCSIIKVASNFSQQFFDCFYNGCLIIIETNLSLVKKHKDASLVDRELLSKSLDLISVLCQYFPNLVKDNQNKSTMLDYIINLIELNDNYVKHYLLALVGDLAKVDNKLLSKNFEVLMNFLLTSLDLPENRVEVIDYEKLSTCNNACWALGLIALNYSNQIRNNVLIILKKLLKIIALPKLNKSLAQNVSICIGRLALIDSQNVAYYLDYFLKQFCLSLRYIKDSAEKREAFGGLCQAIIINPNGVMNSFAFFCDAICNYEDAPEDMEKLFQNIIHSYRNTLREKWMDFFKSFPDKLKIKMTARFRLNHI